MKNASIKSKCWMVAAVAVVLLPVGVAQARAVQRIEYEFTTRTFSDGVTGGGVLQAELTNNPSYSWLNITAATSGLYNSRLSTRCSNNALLETKRFSVTGTSAGDVVHVCGGNLYPLRIEGAIDDLP